MSFRGALGERPRSAVLLLLLTSASGAPVSGSDSAARQEAIDSLVARSSLVELQISGSRTGLVYRVGVEGCLPLRQSGPPRTLYLVAWSLGHTILPSRIQLHPPIGREQFTGAAPLMRSMALAADAGAWRNGISATQKEGKVKARSDHLLDEAAWRTFPHAAKLLARWVDGALEPLPAGVQLLRAEGYPRGNLIDGPPVEYKDLVLLLDDVGVYSLLVGTVSRLLDRLTDRRSAVGEQAVYAVSAELKVEVLALFDPELELGRRAREVYDAFLRAPDDIESSPESPLGSPLTDGTRAAQDRTLLRRLEQQTDDGMAAVDETEILSETLDDGEEDGEDECDQSAGEAAGLLILGSGECEDDQGSEPPSGGDADVEADAAFAHASEESAEL
ncbi:hypothetical protein EMIHUDRAFT_215681 [Emiliania huxleyi CCMP1516]|uniref:Uncharacterized protein n=2 Tax=Emiliania huxleyi TaxID=2903 RepID=A0A0D3IGS6_EMIH1|nr:hypothetical protein EMIHUDRAFT_215681 [Emiliania huxleyi CCMP1516]EOD10461.1 hypothetical protein EMIHUDRAFT_215681 [Emiliania huxleyi CCMP1516]|eukprot:XP_005762890.1 hypothetical protein EMIHUDRAFT_215681 [Emiliania huxleyi CCMP1516]